MKTHVRAGSVAMAGAALLAATLTAGPALAAKPVPGPSLSQSGCEDGGGTYTATKNLKTCTTLTHVITTADDIHASKKNADNTLWATFIEDYVFDELGTTTQTQKKSGPITSTTVYSTSTTRTVRTDERGCYRGPYNENFEAAPVEECAAAGLYA